MSPSTTGLDQSPIVLPGQVDFEVKQVFILRPIEHTISFFLEAEHAKNL